jgi:L-malate glycosyltransferase
MKILVFPHRLEVGGTQVNAIDLAAALRDIHHHEVVMFATPGPMVSLVEKKGLRFLPAPDARFHPAPARMRALAETVRREKPDLLHVWDWWQCIDAYYTVHLRLRIPMIVTDMMMSLTRLLPKQLPTTFGTPELVDHAKAAGRKRAQLLLPPVDVHRNAPGSVDGAQFRRDYGIADREIALVTVSRLDPWMKGDSLIRTIEVVRAIGRELPLRFIIVGDGTMRAQLQILADEVNAELGRPAVLLTGALLDPSAAYAAADIVVGMGGSALRGMTFGKPVVIVGEKSFAAALTPETEAFFYYKGIYGVGDGSSSIAAFANTVRRLAESGDLRLELGGFSRQFVMKHFAVETVSAQLSNLCSSAAAQPPRFHAAAADGLRTAAVYLRERRFLTPSREKLTDLRYETRVGLQSTR